MRRARRPIRAILTTTAAAAAALGLWAGTAETPARADPVALSPDQMRVATTHALGLRDHPTALKLADALIARDPGDMFALVARARALRDLGRYDESLATARDAWARAQTDEDRYASAMVTAQALSSMGRRTRAQIWLRRASQNAPDDRAKARVARDYAHVRDRNPWASHLRFGITPSSNVNNGSSSDIVVIGGLPFVLAPSAQALSGLEFKAAAGTRYRMRPREDLSLYVGGEIDLRRYRLSSAAKASAPGVAGSDFAWSAAELTLGGNWAPDPEKSPVSFELTFGKSWYGGDALADYARAEIARSYEVAPRTVMRLTGSVEQQWRADNAVNDAFVMAGQAALTRRLDRGDLVSLSLGLRDTASDGAAVAHEAVLASVGYRLARPVAGALLGVNLGYEGRDYDMAAFGGPVRRDDRLELGVTAFLPDYDWYGFAPEIGLTATRNSSNVSLYDSEEIGLSIGFRSTF